MIETGPPPKQPVLYSFRRCPYAMRARLAIWRNGVGVELREVTLRDKPAHMLALSPKATVPVLWLPDGRVIDESRDIMVWAYASADPRFHLAADDAPLLEINDGQFKHHLDRYKYASRYPGADAAAHRAAGLAILRQLETRFAATRGGWLGGLEPGFADLAILPFVRQFRTADEAWFDAQTGVSGVQAWLRRFLAWPDFQAVMKKYPPWRAGDAGVDLGLQQTGSDYDRNLPDI